MRTLIDIFITLVLAIVLLWCGILAWGAYSQHNFAISVNLNVLKEMQENISTQIKGGKIDLQTKNSQEIQRLQTAQDKLFDANTSSFIYQFVTLIILTLGTAVLAIMYSRYRREQERANQAENARAKIYSSLGPFASGQNTCIIIVSKYSMLYNLCNIYNTVSDKERDYFRLMMLDYQKDIHRHLEYALREKEGFEPNFHEVILDISDRVLKMLTAINIHCGQFEKSIIGRIMEECTVCHSILWEEGKNFEENYYAYWRKITGSEFSKTSIQ